MNAQEQHLAVNGGPKAKPTPYGTASRFDGNELAYLRQALESNTLFYGYGRWVKEACERIKTYTGRPYAAACTSGSAAIHLGLIAAGVGAGDEVIMPPNTDSGTALGAIAEGAVPVFCDCEENLQASAATVAARITPRTRAVIVVHLAGYPAPVDEIVRLCDARGIAVVEDCAQAWGTRLHDRRVGSFGLAGCFSTNDFKHISSGDGGFVALSDEALYRRVHNYADKCYDRFFGRKLHQAHHGLNYRMGELQGAVVCAQLERVDAITGRHHELGERLRERLKPLAGARMLEPLPGGTSTYWWTALFIDPRRVRVGRDEIVAAIQAEGIPMASYGKYDLINAPLFQERMVRPWVAPDLRQYPFVQPDGRSYTYSMDQTPTHRRMLETGMMMSIKPSFTHADIDETAAGLLKVFRAYSI